MEVDTIMNITSSDYDVIIRHLDEWWGGRNMTDMLPRLFFKHFADTSFIIKNEKDVLGFLVGFVSQEKPELGYVHFIGVNPEYRKNNIGKVLYTTFFEEMRKRKVTIVECVTSPMNINSIYFHQKIGFKAVDNHLKNEIGVSYFEHYDGKEEHRVVFYKMLE